MKNNIIKIIKKAGDLAIKYQDNLTVDKKSDGTIVTNGDLKVSEFLISELEKYHPVLSEESYDLDKIKNHSKYFIIDPIDGSVSYSKKEDTWTILITLVKNNDPIQSYVYIPKEDKLFYALKGGGCFVRFKNNIKNIRLAGNKKRVIVSPNYTLEDLSLVGEYDSLDFCYGAALKVTKLLEGKADFYPVTNRFYGIWDLIGLTLLIREAQGKFMFVNNYQFNIKESKFKESFLFSSH